MMMMIVSIALLTFALVPSLSFVPPAERNRSNLSSFIGIRHSCTPSNVCDKKHRDHHGVSASTIINNLAVPLPICTRSTVVIRCSTGGGNGVDRDRDDINGLLPPSTFIRQRRDVLKTGSVSLIAASIVGIAFGTAVPYPEEAAAAEEKIYSSNAKNMARLNNGDASGGSVYDNNPSEPRARKRRAMLGCKNSSARAVAAKGIGKRKLSEKECNQLAMFDSPDFMLEALVELDCPTCPFGIGSR